MRTIVRCYALLGEVLPVTRSFDDRLLEHYVVADPDTGIGFAS